MISIKLKAAVLLVVSVCMLEQSCAKVWESRDTQSSPRGRGQITPVEYDLGSAQDLQEQLRAMGSKLNKRAKRQSVDNVEEFANISNTAILTNDSHFHALVHWTGFPHENIFILTRQITDGLSGESWLWRSTDYGVSFSNDTIKFASDSIIQYYYISPNTSNLIFADVIHKKIYLTMDTGDTFTAIDVPFTPNRLFFQNRYANHTKAYYRLVLGYDTEQETLWVSTDLGVTWNQIGRNVPNTGYYWRRLDADVEGDLTTVYFEQRLTNTSNESLLYTSVAPYTETRLFNPQLGTFASESFVLEHEYLFVQKPWLSLNQNLTHSSSLLVSYRRNPVFRQAMFPLFGEALEHLHFSVVDASEEFVFLIVYHNVNDTHLYISDVEGTQYVLTLENIAASPVENWINGNPRYDVHITEGLVGVVFANQKFPGSDFGTTVISRNKGGSWAPLAPPAVDSDNNPLLCVPPACSLHLRMETDINSYQSILSQETAVGLIMASGNTGPSLAPNTIGSAAYLSRDGGFTWVEVRSGRWEFQFLALGSIVVMVRKAFLVDEFVWSCDEGQTWQSGVLEDTPRARIAVIGMKTELGEKPRFVSVFGLDYFMYIQNAFVFEWIVFTLNFTSVVNKQCDSTDYFDWMPSDGRLEEEGCLLGEVVSYQRRNSSLCCYVDPEYQKPTDRFTCTCSLEDFECDFGFQRQGLNGACVPAPGFTWPPEAPAYCPEGENYTYSSGYRKIPGDQCDDEEVINIYQPRLELCPVRRAGRLSIIYTPSPATPEVVITFTLSQQEGSTVSTVYEWMVNNISRPLITGLNNARIFWLTFDAPGVYSVLVKTSNEDGASSSTPLDFTVFDTVTFFQVDFPRVIETGSIPINNYFDFNVLLETQYGTRVISSESNQLSWDFGDNTTINHSSLEAGHRYQTQGNYTISIRVSAVIATVETLITRDIHTYFATQLLRIVAEPLIGELYAVVGRPVLITAVPDEGTEIPPDTEFAWGIIAQRKNFATAEARPMFNLTFPSWGSYVVDVTARVPSLERTIPSTILSIQALSELGTLTVENKAMFKVGSFISLTISPFDVYDRSYKGPISVTVTSNSKRLATYMSEESDSDILLGFAINEKGSFAVVVYAENAISEASSNITLGIVGSGEFGDVSIRFNLNEVRPDDAAFLDKLTKAVTEFTAQEYAPNSIVQVRDREFSIPTTTKRQLNLILTIHLEILPGDTTEEAIQEALQAASDVVADVRSGEFSVTVQDQEIKADSAIDRNGEEPTVVITPAPSSPVVEIVIAVIFVVVLIAFVVGLVAIILICVKRYNNLQNKYSRFEDKRHSHLEDSDGGNLTFNEVFVDQELSSGDIQEEKPKE